MALTTNKSILSWIEEKVELVKPTTYKNYDTGYIYRLENCGALLFSADELVMIKEKVITEDMKKAMAAVADSQNQKKGIPDNVIRKIKSRFMEQLTRRGYAYQNSSINAIFDEWLAQKQHNNQRNNGRH